MVGHCVGVRRREHWQKPRVESAGGLPRGSVRYPHVLRVLWAPGRSGPRQRSRWRHRAGLAAPAALLGLWRPRGDGSDYVYPGGRVSELGMKAP